MPKVVDVAIGEHRRANVTAPESWGDTAIGIASRLYMQPGEASIYDLVRRVTDAIWPVPSGEAGSLSNLAEYEALYDVLIQQRAAFNTPVWMNLGVRGRPQQCWACTSGDTRVLTRNGLERIDSMAPGEILTVGGWAPGLAWRVGERETVRVLLSDGRQITCTPDHRFVVGQQLEEAGDLLGQSVALMLGADWVGDDRGISHDDLFRLGYLQGDGSYPTAGGAVVFIGEKDGDVAGRFDAYLPRGGSRYVSLHDPLLDLVDKLGMQRVALPQRGMPEGVFTLTPTGMSAWLRGLFTANGTAAKDGQVSLRGTNLDLMRGVQACLAALRVKSRIRVKAPFSVDWPNGTYVSRESYELRILDHQSISVFADRIGFAQEYKTLRVQGRLRRGKAKNGRHWPIEVVAVVPEGSAVVWDFSVQDPSHVGWTNAIATHNCLILGVDDDMRSIEDGWLVESETFRGGSGSGVNVSKIRAAGEPLAGGGVGSGPISLWMRPTDAIAGVVKSGGRCLPGWQHVYTETGPVTVAELAARPDGFICLSYDPPSGRYKAKRARAWIVGEKRVVRVHTDKGAFDLSADHPVRLSTGEARLAGDLAPGNSLQQCTVRFAGGRARVNLQNGRKGKRQLSQMVAEDVLRYDLRGKVVHHISGDPSDNRVENLAVITPAEHASVHAQQNLAQGIHPFQRDSFPSPFGEANGMHRSSRFWRGDTSAYRAKQAAAMTPDRAGCQQDTAATVRMLNIGWTLLNAGYDINSYESYVAARTAHLGRIGSTKRLRAAFDRRFGGYEGFLAELAARNHRVQGVEDLGVFTTYDVGVDCPTADDKSAHSGHNFVIWPSSDPGGSGIVVFNTRRAAKMVILDVDHPEVVEFVRVKADAENMARELQRRGYDIRIDGRASENIPFQQANNSVRVPDEFMRRVERGEDWPLTYRVGGGTATTLPAEKIWDEICQAAWACGDPGIQFADTINAVNPCTHEGIVRASNPCLTGDTLIATADGRNAVPIRDLVGTEPWVYACDDQGHLSRAQMRHIRKTRERAEVWRVTLDDDSSFRATPDHRVRLRDGSYAEVRALTAGSSLMPFDSVVRPQGWGGTPRRFVRSGRRWARQSWLVAGRQLYDHQRDGLTIDHLDGDSLNDRPDNLELVPMGENIARAKRGDKNPAHNMTPEWRGRIKDAVTGPRNPRYLSVDQSDLNVVYGHAVERPDSARRAAWRNWNLSVRELGLVGKVPLARGDGRIRGMEWAEFAAQMEQAPNHRVVSAVFDGYEDVYDGEVPGPHCFAVVTSVEGDSHSGTLSGFISSNCSEYLWLDNTVCNLASLNLMAYRRGLGDFDADLFERDVAVMIEAMDRLVDLSAYPNKLIEETSKRYRTLGLGYANLGAYLMAEGLPYDSPEGRDLAAAITAYMQAVAVRTSQELAAKHGPYPAYNAEGQHAVLSKHLAAAQGLGRGHMSTVGLLRRETLRVWDTINTYGPLRNAQLTVLAPTGTISLLMGCETTGIEPVLSIDAEKTLVGGGSLDVGVSECVTLGVEAIRSRDGVSSWSDQNVLLGYPSVFQTALGHNTVSPEGHVDMIAAVQPHLSGGVSKTANLPATATVEDVSALYMRAWRSGVKAIAVFRDGCKAYQPVNVPKNEQPKPVAEPRGGRRRPAGTRNGITHKFEIGDQPYYATFNTYDDGSPCEIFLKANKHGSAIGGWVDAFSIALSLGLQYGVPLSKFIEHFSRMNFAPQGPVMADGDIRFADSPLDYLFRWAAKQRWANKIPVTEDGAVVADVSCPVCQGKLVRSGACMVCLDCGETTGCG